MDLKKNKNTIIELKQAIKELDNIAVDLAWRYAAKEITDDIVLNAVEKPINNVTNLIGVAISEKKFELKTMIVPIDTTLKKLYNIGDGFVWGLGFQPLDELSELYKKSVELCKIAGLVETPQPTQNHFNSNKNQEQLATIFERLQKNGYFDANADLQTWLYICGVADLNGDFEPLNWVREGSLLARLVDSLFVADNNKWKLTEKCFKVKGGKPKTNSLKCALSKDVKADNKKHNDLDKLLRV